MRKKIALISGAILLMLLCGFLYIKTTPWYSIYQLSRAVNDHDAETALKFIDVDSVTESLAKSLSAGGGASGKINKDVAAAISMNMPSIKEGVRLYLISVIRSQDDAGDRKKAAAIRLGSVDIHNLRMSTVWRLDVETRGRTAYVKLKDKPGQTATMAKTDEGYWKFVGVTIDKPGKD